jgi:formamidopyrimidine-DNA glycosylase
MTPNVVFKFKKVTLYYTDQLSYGTLTFTQDQAVIDKELNKLAPDIESVTLKTFLEQVDKKLKTDGLIEDAIIDQHRFVSGIGNYLKSEILYHAKISPLRSVHSLSIADWKELFKSAKKVIKRIFKNVNDEHAYMNTMKVYQKEVDPLGNKIQKHKTKEGRTTFWVPSIQK